MGNGLANLALRIGWTWLLGVGSVQVCLFWGMAIRACSSHGGAPASRTGMFLVSACVTNTPLPKQVACPGPKSKSGKNTLHSHETKQVKGRNVTSF